MRLHLEGDDEPRRIEFQRERQHLDALMLLCLRDGEHDEESIEPWPPGQDLDRRVMWLAHSLPPSFDRWSVMAIGAKSLFNKRSYVRGDGA